MYTTPFERISTSINRNNLDALQSENQFVAVALTNAYPVTPQEAAIWGVGSEETTNFSRFAFRGRILGPLSPHETFLADPCDLGLAEDPRCVSALIVQHTEFMITEDYANEGGKSIKINDRVNVWLQSGGATTKFNLQQGFATSLNQEGAERYEEGDLGCTTLAEIFEGADSHSYEHDRPVPIEINNALCQGTADGDMVPQGDAVAVLMDPLNKGAGDIGTAWGSTTGMRPEVHIGIDGDERLHEGTDSSGVVQGEPIYAAAAGKVIDIYKPGEDRFIRCKSGETPPSGKCPADDPVKGGVGYGVTIRHTLPDGSTYDTKYFHMQYEAPFTKGQEVKMGEQIGSVGATGGVVGGDPATGSGAHLHFEVWVDSEVIYNLEDYIKCTTPGTDGDNASAVPAFGKAQQDAREATAAGSQMVPVIE